MTTPDQPYFANPGQQQPEEPRRTVSDGSQGIDANRPQSDDPERTSVTQSGPDTPSESQPQSPLQGPPRPPQPAGFPQQAGPRSPLPSQNNPLQGPAQQAYAQQPQHPQHGSAPRGSGYSDQQGQQGLPGQSRPAHPGVAQPGPAGWSPQAHGLYPGQQPYYDAQQKKRVRKEKRTRIGFGSTLLVIALALVAGGTGGYIAGESGAGGGSKVVEVPVVSASPGADRPTDSVAGIAQAVTPSVVSLEVVDGDSYATGSGFIFSADGYIVTNNHVVTAAEGARITVMLADGSQEPATVVGSTIDYDLAVVKIERSGLEPLAMGDSDAVVVGDPVIAIGAPLGLDGTVTTGIVSAMNRPVIAGGNADTAFINAIQTDAAINPGNSGGPLVNTTGEVIGINSAIAQPPGSAQATGSIGLGFSIPSNQAKRTVTELIETGSATYPMIGVLLDQWYEGEGVMVLRNPPQGESAVTPNSAADRAGLASGDVIVAINGRPVTEPNELIVAIRAKAPGDAVVLTIRPDGLETESEVRMVLDEAVSN